MNESKRIGRCAHYESRGTHVWISRTVFEISCAGDLTCIKRYPLDDAMVTRLIKSLAGDREPGHYRAKVAPRHLILVPVLAVSNRQRHVEFVADGKTDMRPFIYRCPNTGYVVQGHADDAIPKEAPQT